MLDLVFESERLRCRRWQLGDLSAILAVYGDADAMRWVGDGQPISRAQGEAWLRVTENNYRTRGYGMFALVERDSGEVVGFCGLVHPGGQPDAEVKYALRRENWGRGLATEAVTALLRYGETAHGLSRVIATVAPENLASQRVLTKAGLSKSELRRNEDGSHTQIFVWESAARDTGETAAAPPQ